MIRCPTWRWSSRPLDVAAVLTCLAAYPATGEAQKLDPVSPGRAAAQIAIGTVLTPVAFLGIGWGAEKLTERMGWPEDRAAKAGYAGAYMGAWLAAASGPIMAGSDGNALAALGGSLAGMAGAMVTVKLGNWRYDEDRHGCGPLCWSLGVVTVALPSIGATLAYNASRR